MWGGASPEWLAPGIACEFTVSARPEGFDDAREKLDALGVDLNIQPAAGRRKQLLVADMDSTVIEQECMDELAAEAGLGPVVAAITERAMNGEIDFTERVEASRPADEGPAARSC